MSEEVWAHHAGLAAGCRFARDYAKGGRSESASTLECACVEVSRPGGRVVFVI